MSGSSFLFWLEVVTAVLYVIAFVCLSERTQPESKEVSLSRQLALRLGEVVFFALAFLGSVTIPVVALSVRSGDPALILVFELVLLFFWPFWCFWYVPHYFRLRKLAKERLGSQAYGDLHGQIAKQAEQTA